jgi:regulator of protease activity HflC (stomatin/prohibitin superfamily)
MNRPMPLERSAEIRDVRIPTSLEDAMSRKAQADREMEARLIVAQTVH